MLSNLVIPREVGFPYSSPLWAHIWEMLYQIEWSTRGTRKVVPLAHLVVIEDTMSRENLVNIKVTVVSPERHSREDLVRMLTSSALVPVALPRRHGMGQQNPLGLVGSLLINHVHLKTVCCLR